MARGDLVEKATRLMVLLRNNRRISLRRIAAELDMSERSARRWVEAMSGCYPLRIEAGIVIIEEVECVAVQ